MAFTSALFTKKNPTNAEKERMVSPSESWMTPKGGGHHLGRQQGLNNEEDATSCQIPKMVAIDISTQMSKRR